ncbi:MAG: CBS domain-containing protein [Pyrodictiaceae archaeon]
MSHTWIPSPSYIKSLRLRAGLSQRELARRAGVSQSLIARLEKGQVNIRLSTLQKILEALYEVLQNEDVAENYMHSPVITIAADEKVRKAIKLLDEHDISQLPVVDSNGVNIGTILESTILKAMMEEGEEVLDKKVEEIMEEPLPQVSPSTPISVVQTILMSYPAVLVVERGKIKGIITKIDILRKRLAETPASRK